MAGIVGGCEAISPISAGGDSVIRIQAGNINEDVTFPTGEQLLQTISETVSIQVT